MILHTVDVETMESPRTKGPAKRFLKKQYEKLKIAEEKAEAARKFGLTLDEIKKRQSWITDIAEVLAWQYAVYASAEFDADEERERGIHTAESLAQLVADTTSMNKWHCNLAKAVEEAATVAGGRGWDWKRGRMVDAIPERIELLGRQISDDAAGLDKSEAVLSRRDKIAKIKKRLKENPGYKHSYVSRQWAHIANLEDRIDELRSKMEGRLKDISRDMHKLRELKVLNEEARHVRRVTTPGERQDMLQDIRGSVKSLGKDWATLVRVEGQYMVLMELPQIEHETAINILDAASRCFDVIELPEDGMPVMMDTEIKVTGTYYNKVTLERVMAVRELAEDVDKWLDLVRENSNRRQSGGKDKEVDRSIVAIAETPTKWSIPAAGGPDELDDGAGQQIYDALKHLGRADVVEIAGCAVSVGLLRDYASVTRDDWLDLKKVKANDGLDGASQIVPANPSTVSMPGHGNRVTRWRDVERSEECLHITHPLGESLLETVDEEPTATITTVKGAR